MENVLEIQGLSQKFGHHYVLKDINLTIQKGDIYGLIGRNGAGKTTLLKLITQLLIPTQGTIALFGSQNSHELTQALKQAGSVIETPVAYDHLTAKQNLAYYCKLRGIVNAKAVIQETLEFVQLDQTGNKKFKNFSLGMKQKLGIAIALLTRPDFLILDEPINGLDPLAIVEFRKLIKRLNQEKGMTIIISSHILEELYQVANRFGIINDGVLVKEISKSDFDRLSQDYIILETSQPSLASQYIQDQLHHQIKVIDDHTIHIFGQAHLINPIIQALVKADIPVDGIYYSKLNLEAYFTDLVTNTKEEFTC
ncbi:ABC transporter ATP-binding protein [Vaginisenegalia massiliensis]|uniref:ABC transporter ATP-binding protein n=1 Tax=Vaginisenegalia massiliensis TaxID=2058294 RepID=UPI000F5204CD|nr:ABC transporter ATP-binding protein [Vaginisenegalia massiliensis]